MLNQPYTYYLYHRPTGLKYYGVRFAKNCHPGDLWTKYFTSSKYVKQLIEKYGAESFDYEVRRIFSDSSKARAWESKVLLKLKAPLRSDWLNKTVNKFELIGFTFTVESIEKRAKKLRGQRRSVKTRKKMSESQRKYLAEHPEITAKRLSNLAGSLGTGVKKMHLTRKANGYFHTEETKRKIRETTKKTKALNKSRAMELNKF